MWSRTAPFGSGCSVCLRRRRKMQPFSDICLSGHVGIMLPFASTKVEPPTDWLGRAGAAQDIGRGLLGPGDKVADVTMVVTSPRVVPEGHHTEGHQLVQSTKGQRGKPVMVQMEMSKSGEAIQRAWQHQEEEVVRQINGLQIDR